MKIAFLVLLMAVAVFALWDDNGKNKMKRPSSHSVESWPGNDCEDGDDCKHMCNWQCFDSVDELCIDGSCYCEIMDDRKKS